MQTIIYIENCSSPCAECLALFVNYTSEYCNKGEFFAGLTKHTTYFGGSFENILNETVRQCYEPKLAKGPYADF